MKLTREELIKDCLQSRKKIKELEAELTLTKHALKNATAKLHGTRNHLTEVTMREDGNG